MTRARVQLGKRGEALAEEKLASLGYQVVARNYRCRAGEIDLIATHRSDWVFIEVRTRRGRAYGTPEQSVTRRKREHLIAAAQTYLQERQLADASWRIDAVAVELSVRGELLRVDVIENAVQG